MSKAIHTPGPWRIEYPGDCIIAENVEDGGNIVCLAPDWGYSKLHWELGNRSLIAAAPDLLAACKEALGAFENNNAIDWNILTLAIAKAEQI